MKHNLGRGLVILGLALTSSTGIAEDDALPQSATDQSRNEDGEFHVEETSAPSESLSSTKPKSEMAKPEAPKLIAIPEGGVVSEGSRIEIDGKGFSIVVPAGWIVQKGLPRASLFAQARVFEGEYPRNISVLRFPGPKFINQQTAEDFSERLVRTFPSASSTIENYSLRNHQTIQMDDGREGILIYTDFTGSGRKMMQAHVLVSSETNHYLATFTDLAEHFETSGEKAQFLTEAWTAMTSIQLDSPNPAPSQGLEIAIGLALGVALFGIGFSVTRRVLAARSYRDFSGLNQEEASALVPNDAPKGLTTGPSAIAFKNSTTERLSSDDESFNDDVAFHEENLDEAIQSGVGQRLFKIKPKVSKKSDDEDEGLAFTSGEDELEIKKGA